MRTNYQILGNSVLSQRNDNAWNVLQFQGQGEPVWSQAFVTLDRMSEGWQHIVSSSTIPLLLIKSYL